MSDKVDKLFEELEAEKAARQQTDGAPIPSQEAAAIERIQEERKNKVSGFKLDLDLEQEYAEHMPDDTAEAGAPAPEQAEDGRPDVAQTEGETVSLPEESNEVNPEERGGLPPMMLEEADETEEAQPDEQPDEEPADAEEKTLPAAKKKKKRKKGQNKTAWGCVKGLIYAVLVLGISGTLAFFAITGGIDMTGINKSDVLIDVDVPEGATTEEIAQLLKDKGVIDQPLIFRLYTKLKKADALFQPGTFTVSPSMGYGGIIEVMQTTKPRETVTVTIKEGYTLDQIAKELEAKGVCTASDFYKAAVNENNLEKYKQDYDFIAAIPTKEDGEEYAGRIYMLEGYLFPDTYYFYTGSSADTVIRKMLDNFGSDNRVGTSIRAAAKAKGMTIDELITIASIIQGEAAKPEDMLGVSRVIQNRLNNPATYPRLECDSTQKYIRGILPQGTDNSVSAINGAYDTYERSGLPVGPIGNPGLQAIQAVLNPSEEENIVDCFFFATDSNGTTYYSETLAQHEKVCREHGIGMYG